jgi:L-threonylcarbamoyladenylate synthase
MKIISENNPNAIDLACENLRAGKVISFACDTVYGLAVDATNFKAVENLYKIKNREKNKPIAIFLKDLKSAEKIFHFDETAKRITEKYLLESLTVVLKTKEEAISLLASNLNQNKNDFLGFRIVNYKFVQNLLEKFDGILAVTSANPANQPAAISAGEVEKYFDNIDNLSLLVDGGECAKKIASTVIKIHNNQIEILRQGSVIL